MSDGHQEQKPLLQELDEAARAGANAKELHLLRRARIPLATKMTEQDKTICATIVGAQKKD